MVDISSKRETTRLATATATLLFSNPQTYSLLVDQQLAKGDAIAVARIAAIQAAKKTSDLIPLAHPALNITSVSVSITPFSGKEQSMSLETTSIGGQKYTQQHSLGGVTVEAAVRCQGKTGIEMEAITAATLGAITLYDMLKAVDKGMVINAARVIEKRGGKSGDWTWDPQTDQLVKTRSTSNIDSARDVYNIEPSNLNSSSQQDQTLSELDEWNAGLTGEFLIREASDEESGPDTENARIR